MFWRNSITRKADKVIVPSDYLREEALRNGFAEDKIDVVPHFTEKNMGGEIVGPEDGSVLFVGRTDPLKGISELLRALSLIREQNWKAYIVGIGDDLHSYKLRAKELGIEHRVLFLSNLAHADLDEYYKRASVLVFPSMSPESFGLVGIEAMSFGRPVVAFDVGGPREWLIDGETGFIVKRGDVLELSRRISQLLGDTETSRSMGFKGRERVNKLYRKGAHTEKILAVYEEAIQMGSRKKQLKSGCD